MTISLADGITLPLPTVNASAGGVTGILPVGNGGTGIANASNTSITVGGNAPLRINVGAGGANITVPASGNMVVTDSSNTGNLNVTGQFITTVSQGTAPVVTGSNTVVANLNVSLLQGGNWAAPGSNVGTTTAVPQANMTLINNANIVVTSGATVGTGIRDIGRAWGAVAANQSVASNTTLNNATGMSFTIAANEVWRGHADMDFGAALTTTGIKVALSTPAGSTIAIAVGLIPDGQSATSQNFLRSTAQTGVDFGTALVAGAFQNALGRVSFYVANGGNAGTAQLQFAQSTSSVTAVTLHRGSGFEADRIS